jgi:hypothetical protein
MFAGFGILSGGAHVAGQEGDRSSFQLASAAKFFYSSKPYRATLEVFGRKQSDGKLINSDEKAKHNHRSATHV